LNCEILYKHKYIKMSLIPFVLKAHRSYTG